MRTHLRTCMKCLTNLVQNIKLCGLPRTVFKNEAQHVPSRFFNVEGGTRRRVYRATQCIEDFKTANGLIGF